MGLQIQDKWIWDFWFAQDGPDYHIFYLQAPNHLGDQLFRHFNVSIGHAVSQDLIRWQVLPDALGPSTGTAFAWDNYTTWTGSIIHHAGLWYMFYTGGMREERALVQRIGFATSNDLIHWEKFNGNPLIEADPRWYELLDLTQWHDQAWRDPWVFRHQDRFHALITGRVKEGPSHSRGVIAHASSEDLIRWTVHPPVSEPGDFGHLEVPQLVEIQGHWYLIFCVNKEAHAAARRLRGAPVLTGTHYLFGDHPLGPFHLIEDDFLLGDPIGEQYAGKMIQDPDGQWVLMTFRNFDRAGQFIGDIADPLPVGVSPEGRLFLK